MTSIFSSVPQLNCIIFLGLDSIIKQMEQVQRALLRYGCRERL